MTVPYGIEVPDRIPKQRYYDADFYALEAEQLWSRTWQNLASFSALVPRKAAGSSNDQCIRLEMPGQVVGQFLSASSQTVMRC